MNEPDIEKGSWIKVAQEWVPLNEQLNDSRPAERVEARAEAYGCDTGCVGYRIYLVSAAGEKFLGDGFYFCGEEAIGAAEEFGRQFTLPVVVEKELSW